MSNQYISKKVRVQRDALCYICEKAPGVVVDEVSGRLCESCHAGVQAMRLKYATKGGYEVKSNPDTLK